MRFTGERLIVGNSPLELEAEHVARYEFAASFCKGKTVLDLGCGTGYGSAIIAKVAKDVLGIDISREAIRYARKKYQAHNLNFEIMDISDYLGQNKKYECIICLEVIEHISQPQKTLSDISFLLSEQGILILSTPNGLNPKFKFHVHGWNREGLVELLSPYLSIKELLGQEPSLKVIEYQRCISQLLAVIDSQILKKKQRHILFRLVKFIPKTIKKWIYRKIVERKLPVGKKFTSQDFPIGTINDKTTVLIAVCEKLRDR